MANRFRREKLTGAMILEEGQGRVRVASGGR